MNTLDKQQRLQELLLELARPETKITGQNLEQYIFRLQDIYEADFRHLYSGVFGVITSIDADDASELARLQENIQTLHTASVSWLEKKRGHVSEDFCHRLEKLYDHVNLDISRINYTQEIANRMEEKNRKAGEEIKQLSEKATNMQKDYITILGIFSSIVITSTTIPTRLRGRPATEHGRSGLVSRKKTNTLYALDATAHARRRESWPSTEPTTQS